MPDTAPTHSPARPNVLFITVDQWRGDLMPGEGGWFSTPNLDALTAEGARFAAHYCQAYPCGPARAGLVTGLYPHKHRSIQNGTPLDARHRTIFQAARAAGYRPALFGYTDTTPDPRSLSEGDPARGEYEGIAPGLDAGCLLTEMARPWIAHLLARGYDIANPAAGRQGVFAQAAFGEPAIFAAEDSETAFLTDRVLGHLATQGAEPFFLHLSYIAPHPPFAAARDWLEQVDPEALPPLMSRRTNETAHPLLAAYRDWLDLSSFAPGLSGPVADAPDSVVRTIRQAYAAMGAEVDHHIGRILDRLKATGQWENTIVILSGDHGEQMFEHGLLGKLGWYDGSARIPLVIRTPGGVAGQRVTHFTQSIDIFPTLVDLLELERDANLDGQSLLPFLRGADPVEWRDAAFWSHDFRNLRDQTAERRFGLPSRLCNLHVVRTERFKYVHFPALPPVLYDLTHDPAEEIDLADDPAARSLRAEGVERLLNLRLRHEDETLSCLQAIDGTLYGSRS
ncbi:sulfatase [Ciceribacter naphthalenivorans]|uniref:Sulfatase n=2 Tax=Alphaproteobacteria TaxID=28211 RepID=A0A512HGZ7_9HYPH|nr:sulfatase [Ciceribacter naphthalenivorans]GLR20652.1 sulfatase [Ciceribacter naphthalenivorans]GLT03508.1 sulfatase [Sphingomonas psychrolutea]